MSMIHDITTEAPRWKKRMRKGRGESSGKGKTCGKGNKGSKARNGKYIKRGYEGGQTPIFRRFPKRGFSNVNFTERYHVINLGDLGVLEVGTTITQELLAEKGLIPNNAKLPLKVLSEGGATKAFKVQADRFSHKAYDGLIAAGGTPLNTKGEAYVFRKIKKKFVLREDPKKAKKSEEAAPAEAAKKE